MTGTAAYLAGIEANSVQISYGIEATWGTAPATTFQALRSTGESLAGKKNRSRPLELNTTAQSQQAITQSVSADGAINFAFSWGTYDDLFASLFNNDWTADLAIVGVAADIAITASTSTIASTTTGKFTNVVVGQWIKLSGFTNTGNNGWARVATKADNQTLTVTGLILVDETPTGTLAHIKGSMLRNSNTFKSLFIQKELDATHWLTYAGAQVTQMTFTQQQGKFIEGSFTVMAKVEASATADSSSGGVTAAPTGRVIDTVADFQALSLDGTAIAATANTMDLTVQKTGAAAQYGLGSPSAQGMIIGQFTLSGTMELYFKDFTYYAYFISEAAHALSFRVVDFAGKSYVFTVPYATFMNPTIVAGSANTSVMAKFEVEGNPDPITGCTLQVDRFV